MLTDRRVVNVQRLGRHELAHQRRLARARGAQHGYAERLRDSRATGAARLSGRRQRRAGTGPRRSRIGTAAAAAASATTGSNAAHADYRVVGGRQVFRAAGIQRGHLSFRRKETGRKRQ